MKIRPLIGCGIRIGGRLYVNPHVNQPQEVTLLGAAKRLTARQENKEEGGQVRINVSACKVVCTLFTFDFARLS